MNKRFSCSPVLFCIVRFGALLIALFFLPGLAQTAKSNSSRKPAVPTTKRNAVDPSFQKLNVKATQAREENRNEEACRIYEELVKLRPAWAEGWWYLGTLYYEQKLFVAAGVSFEKYTALEPENGQGWGLLGLSEYQTKDLVSALKHLIHARALGFGDNQDLARNVRFHEAVLLTRSLQFEEALAILVGFGVEHLESSAVLDAMGAAVLRISEPTERLSAQQQEMVRLFGKATFLAAERKIAESFKLYQQLESSYRGQPNVAYAFGLALQVQKDPNLALEYFKAELARDSSHVPAMLQIAFRMLETSQFEQCIKYARKVVELEPGNYAGYYLEGRVLFYSQEYGQSIPFLEKASSLAPELASIQYALYEAYRRAGRKEDAMRARERFARLDALEKQQAGGVSSSPQVPVLSNKENTQPEPQK